MSTEQLREVLDLLVDDPVEPRGILSRIEHHLARLLKEQNEIANHDAQIMAARYEFTREFLVQMDGRLARIEAILYGTEARERAMTRLVDLERRIKKLEQRHERHDDDQAGGAGSETAAAQDDGPDGPGRGADR